MHVYSIRKNTLNFRRLRRLIYTVIAVLQENNACIIRKNTPHLQPLIVLAIVLFIKEHRECSAPVPSGELDVLAIVLWAYTIRITCNNYTVFCPVPATMPTRLNSIGSV